MKAYYCISLTKTIRKGVTNGLEKYHFKERIGYRGVNFKFKMSFSFNCLKVEFTQFLTTQLN